MCFLEGALVFVGYREAKRDAASLVGSFFKKDTDLGNRKGVISYRLGTLSLKKVSRPCGEVSVSVQPFGRCGTPLQEMVCMCPKLRKPNSKECSILYPPERQMAQCP